MRPDQPIPPSDPTPVTVTKPTENLTREAWTNRMAAVMDMYYGERLAWDDRRLCLPVAVICADPAWLGPDRVHELVRRLECRRRFDAEVERWLNELNLTNATAVNAS